MSWTAPEVNRPGRPWVADEVAILDAFLEFQRSTLLLKCSGLAAEQLASQPVPPSNLSLLGIVRHMVDVELTVLQEELLLQRHPGHCLPRSLARLCEPGEVGFRAVCGGFLEGGVRPVVARVNGGHRPLLAAQPVPEAP
jgi:hypothetical protein